MNWRPCSTAFIILSLMGVLPLGCSSEKGVSGEFLCAPRCAWFCSLAVGVSVTESEIVDLFPNIERRGWSSFADIERALDSLDIVSVALNISAPELKNISLPAIAHYGNDHFVAIYKIKGEHIYFFDPGTTAGSKMQRMQMKEFEAKFDGNIMCVSRPPFSKEILAARNIALGTSAMYFGTLICDLGEVAPHGNSRGSLQISNVGGRELEILGGITDCRCAVVDVKGKVIESLESDEIVFEVETEKPGPIYRKAWIKTDGAERGIVEFILTGMCVEYYRTIPRYIFVTGENDAGKVYSVVVRNNSDYRWRYEDIHAEKGIVELNIRTPREWFEERGSAFLEGVEKIWTEDRENEWFIIDIRLKGSPDIYQGDVIRGRLIFETEAGDVVRDISIPVSDLH